MQLWPYGIATLHHQGDTMTSYHIQYPSPLGDLDLIAHETALTHIYWPAHKGAPEFEAQPGEAHPILQQAQCELEEYFRGERKIFTVPIDLKGTSFQREVWSALQDIPWGEVRTYAQQAQAIGRPRSVRAVGSANGRNPISIIVPCHRVIGSNGTLTGYAGGVDVKSWLLQHEQGFSSSPKQKTLSLFE